ncbi:MAG TPA: type IV pilus twitching motility protein PilT [Kofleriaceae bacterium]|nr:type IV pilus twitching motility protein PilT [Kofleriaceae bacterium]
MLTMPQLLRFAVQNKASDVHLSAGEPPRFRVHGEIVALDHPPLSAEETHRLIFDVMNDAQRRTFQDRLEADFAFALDDDLRFRVNAFVQNRGEGAVFRTIPTKIPRFEDLGLPSILRELCDEEKGLVLVTGPTGSGKSTTLASMIDYLNETMAGHILTLEDPIEFVHRSKRSLVNQREVGTQTQSFSNALRSGLREDPDVILVGELRDLETISLALTAAETGHLVFGTVHTSSAAKTVDRIVDVFPPNQQAQVRTMVSESLLGVATQMLLHKVGGGRAAAIEVLVGTPAVRNLIREGKTHQIPSAMQVGAKAGMVTMEAAVMDLVNKGVVTVDEAKKRVPDLAHLFDKPAVAPVAARGAVR